MFLLFNVALRWCSRKGDEIRRPTDSCAHARTSNMWVFVFRHGSVSQTHKRCRLPFLTFDRVPATIPNGSEAVLEPPLCTNVRQVHQAWILITANSVI